MPTQKPETYTLGGVDSRSNPCNFPPERSLRCLNWAPQQSGALRLRSGYTVPMPATNDTIGATTIHSLIYYELFSAAAVGPQYLLYGKGSNILQFNIDSGASQKIGAMPSTNPWGHFRATNRIHIGDGVATVAYGYSFGFQNWDGTTLRQTGIPTLATPGTLSVTLATPSTAGSFAPTTLGGYQFYGAWYDPITQHMGNCTTIGSPANVTNTDSLIILTGFGIPPNPEWVTAVGMTNDGGQIPYWLMDANGNHIVIGNTATVGTISIGNQDVLSELPFRNIVPGPFDKFARVQTRIFANLSGSPYIYYSNDVSDVQNANYVGNPEESWPLDQAEAFPTGELPTSIHAYRFEGWFFSRNNLAIWSTLLQQQGANPWRGPWPGGCAGQRAFVETPYGPYWVSWDLQLCTFMDDGVISVSEEYELALLGKIAQDNISETEVGYLLDPSNRIDQIMIRGWDKNGDPVIVLHDFLLKDARSPFGCGYEYLYTGITPNVFTGAGYTPRQNAIDSNGKNRLWVGNIEGSIAQLEDGSNSDNGATYAADHITIVGVGSGRPSMAEIEWQGDDELVVSYSQDYSQTLAGFKATNPDLIPGETSRYGAKMDGQEARWLYCRVQLTAHPDDGDFLPTDPPNVPMPTYGCINEVTLKIGKQRPEGR